MDQLINEADGSFIPIVSTQGKHKDGRKNRKVSYEEARLCASQEPGQTHTRYAVTMGEVDEVGQRWATAAREAGRGLNTQMHCLGDGATWIEKQAQVYLQPKRYLVDFYHVCGYLSDAQESCAKNSRWMATQKNRLKSNRVDRVLSELHEHLEPPHLPDENSPVRRAHRYLNNRIDQLDYQGSLAEGLPIGSGLIESGHKHVLQARLKIAGASWSRPNAQSMAQARSLRANKQWELYWN